MRTIAGPAVFVSIVLASIPSGAGYELPSAAQVLSRVKETYSRYCCFQASFSQLTVNVAMDMTDRFEGTLFVKRPGQLALDVHSPEKQKVVVRGRSYSVYFLDEGSSVKGEVPADLNVEHFFNFFANIAGLDRDFEVSFPNKAFSKEEELIFLELRDRKNPTSTYRIVLGIHSTENTIRRAVIYDALGNYNRFDLSEITFMKSIPESRFELSPGVPRASSPAGIPFFEESEKQ